MNQYFAAISVQVSVKTVRADKIRVSAAETLRSTMGDTNMFDRDRKLVYNFISRL